MTPETQPAVFITALTIVLLITILTGLKKAFSKSYPKNKAGKNFITTALIIILWVATLAVLSINDVFNNFSHFPPRPVLAMIIPVIILAVLIFSGKTDKILSQTPMHWIIGLQSFRILVEIMLWMADKKGLMPVQMTFEGYNFDIITALLAIPCAIYLKKTPGSRLSIFFNVIGILLLINVLAIALLSMPTGFRVFKDRPSMEIVGRFPFIFLPGFLVVVALALHFLSLRKLYLYTKM
ncbi:MAG: hypothetical protein JWN76_1304 [Chitinophagaceae bacterium]|nr:hypothetical protein [Chitinophagaceae bacterium]